MGWRIDPQLIGDAITDVLRPNGLPRKVDVPDVVGQRITEARLALTREGLRTEVHRDAARPPAVEGRVVLQEPEPGTRARRRSVVRLLLTFPTDQG